MLLFSKTIHVLALGLWFGTACFFTVAALSLFQTFEAESLKGKEARPLWFPLPEVYAQDPPSAKFPDPLRKEQGSRAARRRRGADLCLVLRHPSRLRRYNRHNSSWLVVITKRKSSRSTGRAVVAGAGGRRFGMGAGALSPTCACREIS